MIRNVLSKLLIAVVLVCLVLPLTATEVGVKGGMGFVNGSVDPEIPDFEMKTMSSIQIGAFASLNISDIFVIHPEVNYAVRGGKGVNLLNNTEGKWKIGYVEVPILLGINLPTQGALKLKVYAGPYMAFKLNAKEVVEDPEEETDITDRINNIDAGAVIGAQISVPVGTSASLVLDGRYCHGLSNNMSEEDVEFSVYKFYNRAFVFSVGFGFNASN
jgi:hypothetical protein